MRTRWITGLCLRVSLIAGILMGLFCMFRPYDIWWAGSIWSRPSVFSIGSLLCWLALLLVTLLPPRTTCTDIAPSSLTARQRKPHWGITLPVIFAAYCLFFPAEGALADRIRPSEDVITLNTLDPGRNLFVLASMKLAGSAGLSGEAGLRMGLAILGAIWSSGLYMLFSRVLGCSRGILIAAGATFSLMSAQFAGYFESSGMIIAFIPLLVFLVQKRIWSSRRLHLLFVLLGIAGSVVFHGAALCLIPALACSTLSPGKGIEQRYNFTSLFQFLTVAGMGLSGAWILAWLICISWGTWPFSMHIGVGADNSMLVPLLHSQLETAHFSQYPLFSWEWLWDRVLFLSAAGPGILFALLVGAVSFTQSPRRLLPPLCGFLGSLSLFWLWNFDWGLVRDWNNVAPWLVSAALFALVAGKSLIRNMHIRHCWVLAIALAWPGIGLTLHNSIAGTDEGLPDVDRWEKTTGRGKYRLIFADTPGWDCVILKESIQVDDGTTVNVSLQPRQYTSARIDRLELRPTMEIGGAILSCEAEDLLQTDGRGQGDRNSSPHDDRWGIEVSESAGNRYYAGSYRSERVTPLSWTIRPPRGEYNLHVCLMSGMSEPPAYLHILYYDVTLETREGQPDYMGQ